MKKSITRRNMLKTSTAAVGAVAGAGLLKGFPAIHAADAPTIRYLGTAVNMGDAVQKRLFDDTGIKVKFIVKTTDEVVKTIFTQPNSFDIVDSEYFSMPKLVPSGNLLGMDTKRIKEWDNVTSAFTKGEVAGKKIGDQGTAPKKVMYLKGSNSKEFASEPTQHVTLIPTVYNADTLGIRPDLIKRPISTWAELLNPEFKGNIDIEINSNNDYIICRLTDNGPGITDAKKAMTPYFTTKKIGTGLGLPIVTKIINEHSGSFILKNSSKEKGTIVTILLPKYNA